MGNCDLISVIVPTYNDEKYIAQALDSILKQTYDKLEVLVVDDGSTDSTPTICDKYALDAGIKVFHRLNSGLSASRQFGIDHCNGAYFVTIDADDYIAVDYIEKLYAAIKKNNADISVCGVSCFLDKSGEIVNVCMPNCKNEKLVLTKELLTTDFYRISEDFILTDSWNKMHRTQFVRDTNVKYELPHTYVGQDMWFELRLALHCPIYCTCSESLLFHRKHQGGMMARKSISWQEGFEIITERLIEDSRSLGLLLKKQLSNIYYGMIGILVLNFFFSGKSVKELHPSFKALVARNRSFMDKHRGELVHKCFRTFKLSKWPIPLFVLSSAILMDVVISALRIVYSIKKRSISKGKIRQLKSDLGAGINNFFRTE